MPNPYVKETFNPGNERHTHYISQKCAAFSQQLKELQQIDNNIFSSGMATGVGFAIKFVPFVGYYMSDLVVIGAGIYASHHVLKRVKTQEDYQQTLEELYELYSWIREQGPEKNLASVTVQQLILTLAPWIPFEDLHITLEKNNEANPDGQWLNWRTAGNMMSSAMSFFSTGNSSETHDSLEMSREGFMSRLSVFEDSSHIKSTEYQFYGRGNNLNWYSYLGQLLRFSGQVASTALIEETPKLVTKLLTAAQAESSANRP